MSFVIRNIDKVIVGDGKVLSNADIYVKDGKVSAIGAGLTVPENVEVRYGSGFCAMPGLWDTHCHVQSSGGIWGVDKDMLPEAKAIRAAAQAEPVVLSGTTTLADAGCDGNISFALRDTIAAGIVRGPRLLICGYMIRMTGGRAGKDTEGEVDGPDSARKATRKMIAKGVDFIKLGATGAVSSPGMKQWSPQLTLEEITAACEEAHKAGLKVHSHAYGDEGINLSIRGGADVVVHGITLNDENLQLMKDRSIQLLATLSTYKAKLPYLDKLPRWQAVKHIQVCELLEANFKRAVKAGIDVVAGTDSGMTFNYFGRSSRELDYMVEMGMTPAQAIKTATISAARSFGLDHETGSLAAGKAADILLVRGDPLADIGVLGKAGGVAQVFVAGRLVAAFDECGKEIG
ncbi:MAG: amidohydrolase family protein [Bacillota bacterium]|nr:amidohydrolase family protein [Bacillota bacterium]